VGMQHLSIEARPIEAPHYEDMWRKHKELQAEIQLLTLGMEVMHQQMVDMEEEEALQE